VRLLIYAVAQEEGSGPSQAGRNANTKHKQVNVGREEEVSKVGGRAEFDRIEEE